MKTAVSDHPMLVVTDQRTAGIRRQRRLAGARQAEEHRRRSVRAHIGRTVHRHHARRRQKIVEQAEDRLLHLARIAGAADQDQLLGHVDRDDGRGTTAMTCGVGAEAGQVDDRIVGDELAQFMLFRADQHRADEQIMPGQFVDDAHAHPVLGLRSAIEILDEQIFLLAERGEEIGLERGEVVGAHRLVGLAPPDGVAGLVVADHELVLRRTPGVLARLDHQRAVRRQLALTTRHGGFDQPRGDQVPVERGTGLDPLRLQTDFRNPFVHKSFLVPQGADRDGPATVSHRMRIRMRCTIHSAFV
ncbi:hypothetical protein QE379_002086 [Sphingomonas sp. SORGH_AS 879]|nr:hypothetical protein [Sphingomonas sp. SORGH_AS_0879]